MASAAGRPKPSDLERKSRTLEREYISQTSVVKYPSI
jgi:hypothetical protein